MAKQNPTGNGVTVALQIPSRHRKFLRDLFAIARDGIRDDLESFPHKVRDPARLRREEAVYDALLSGVEGGSIVVSGDIRCVLLRLASAVDRENEHERVVAEHAALLGLRRQVSEGFQDHRGGAR